MPELPEVETMRRGVQSVTGMQIVSVRPARCRLKPLSIKPPLATWRRHVVGRTIAAVDRLGKRVVLRLDSGAAIVIEPRMTGLVLLADPPNRQHLRLIVDLSPSPASRNSTQPRQLLFWDRRGLGTIELLRAEELAARLGDGRLGPDALGISVDELQARLSPSRRAIKVALLDQRGLAGVGNLYASEILFLAGVHPQRECRSLRPAQWRAIHAAMRHVLSEAIRYEGSTLGDGTYRNALNEAGSYQNHHQVYARNGKKCLRCGKAEVVRIVQAQRSTFFCPKCQRKPRVERPKSRAGGA